jgi:hypothetical protein
MCNECTFSESKNVKHNTLNLIRVDKDGKYHCKTYPCYELFFENKKLWSAYKIHGRLHREDGPAVIEISKDGVEHYSWYIDGFSLKVSSQEEFVNSTSYKEWKLRAFK